MPARDRCAATQKYAARQAAGVGAHAVAATLQ
jgi:DNA transposition AAA+ family ATPase